MHVHTRRGSLLDTREHDKKASPDAISMIFNSHAVKSCRVDLREGDTTTRARLRYASFFSGDSVLGVGGN